MGKSAIKTVTVFLVLISIYFANSTMDSYTLGILNNIAIFAILALSYNLINAPLKFTHPNPSNKFKLHSI